SWSSRACSSSFRSSSRRSAPCSASAADPRARRHRCSEPRLFCRPRPRATWAAMAKDLVLILDFGSQTTQLIARRVRESKVYCEIHPCTMPIEEIRAKNPRAIILSGGPASVYEENAPSVDKGVFDLGRPVLGICYGMQLTAHLLGGKVERSQKR